MNDSLMISAEIQRKSLSDRLVAHRGYASNYPENSLLAIERAVAEGARYVEVDLQLTADLQPVLYHDRNMARLSGAENKIQSLTYDELKKYRLHNSVVFGDRFADEPIAHLKHLINLIHRYPEVIFFIEFKRVAIETFGVEACLDCTLPLLQPVESQLVLISYSQALVESVIQKGWSVGWVSDQYPEQSWWLQFSSSPQYLFLNYNCLKGINLSAEKVAWPGTALVLYELTDAKQAQSFFEQGADLIETFEIEGMRNALSMD